MVRVRENINNNFEIRNNIEPQKEILLEMTNKIKTSYPCVINPKQDIKEIEKEHHQYLGTFLLYKLKSLFLYYQNEPDKIIILNELKEKIEKIKNNNLPNYNKKMVIDICDYLTC